ncbi:MAG TPA: hypothetical protein VNO81_03440, partial [Candidatus Nitrosotenuis sp.]|nr:hypothetical protein [Candidatus Nitrosotenuis sp.]
DRAIAGARRLVTLAGGALGAREAAEATAILRGILPHVSDCEGLSIMVERMPESTVAAVLQARQRALAEGLDLLTWASEVRGRPA